MLFCPISDINWIVEKAVVCRMHYRNHINLNTSFNVTYCRSLSVKPFVVYFDQFLGAAHPKSWLKSSFSAKKAEKREKSKKFAAKFIKKHVFLSLHQNAGLLFYSQKNELFSLKTHFYL